jgi:hypothetical protein
MTRYRLLERLIRDQEWQPDGVAYVEEGLCLLYRRGQIWRLDVSDLTELGEKHHPYEKGSTFQWEEGIREWDKTEPFDPITVLRPSSPRLQQERRGPRYRSADEMPQDIKRLLLDINLLWGEQEEILFKEEFVAFQEYGYPPYRLLVEALWHRWALLYKEEPPFPNPEHNVALLLYARAFGLPVEENSAQKEYLTRYRDLYAPLVPKPHGWGARASLSKNVLVTLDSPVMHVWVFKKAEIPQRIVIIGRGLAAHREKVFSDALVTAMRVQASALDVFNAGLISIERKLKVVEALDIDLPVLGANAPLTEAETAEAAMREMIRQLRRLEQDTGFVQIHESDITDVESLEHFLRRLATEAMDSASPILWAPDSDVTDSKEELVTIHPILKLFHERRRAGRRSRVPPFELSLSPELLGTESWKRLVTVYEEYVINRIAMDAQIRLDFYERRAKGLRDEKNQWDKADEYQRQQRWGPTVTLNQRFDDATGLTIWLQPPTIIPTKRYYEENVPDLIRSYDEWAAKMQGILEGLHTATQRQDSPFQRLITTRFFDAALRGREPEETPRILKLYREWAVPMADLLRFEWRKRLRSVRAQPEDLFNAHTTFNLTQLIDEQSTRITELLMTPYTLLDAKRSVVLFDPGRAFMIVNDASDYPQEAPFLPPTDDLWQELLQQYESDGDVDQLVELLREKLTQNPQQTSRQIIDILRPQITGVALSEDSDQVRKSYQEGLANTSLFPRLVDLAQTAMTSGALLTARESLEEACRSLPDLLKRWHEMRDSVPEERLEHLSPIPEKSELECRLHLLMAIAECLATGYDVKEHLSAIHHAPQAGGRSEIRDALAAADNADPQYTGDWIEYLSQWELGVAYNKLMRDLPSEQDLTSPEQHSAMRVFDAVELMRIATDLRTATATLSHIQETRTTALVKLAPALERALLSYAANVAYGDLVWLLEILTGRQVAFGRGV